MVLVGGDMTVDSYMTVDSTHDGRNHEIGRTNVEDKMLDGDRSDERCTRPIEQKSLSEEVASRRHTNRKFHPA